MLTSCWLFVSPTTLQVPYEFNASDLSACTQFLQVGFDEAAQLCFVR